MNLSIADTVKDILIQYPESRDSDELLQLKVWARQYPQLRSKTYRYWDWAILFRDKKLASAESIRRSRQKLQEKHPELRGDVYYERHKRKGVVVEQLRNFD